MHEHNHSHNINIPHDKSLGKALLWGIILNIIFVLAEAFAGWWGNSMALLSDAGHNFSDVVSLILALLAFTLAQKLPNSNYTYGYKKGTILASFINALLLGIAVVFILIESIEKIANPQSVDSGLVIWVAALGIVDNGFTTALLFRYRSKDLNAKGAFLHMLGDTLVSVGVLVSGIAIKYTGFLLLDPIMGIIIAILILVSTWHLFTQSMRLVLDGVPEGVNIDKIKKEIAKIKGVANVHHLHVWALSTTENALTAHIVLADDITDSSPIKEKIKELLHKYNIKHVTLETERDIDLCNDQCCR